MKIPRGLESVPDYIICVKDDDHCVSLTRLRVSSNWLSIITEAWYYVRREQLLCHLRKNGVGDEFHFLFQCDKLHDLRVCHFGANFCGDISILNNPHFPCQLAVYIVTKHLKLVLDVHDVHIV